MPLRRTLAAGFFLAVLILLNAATVLPALHALAHDHDGCDQPDCVVVALAQGGIHSAPDPARVVRFLPAPLPAPAVPAFRPAADPLDCPRLPARAPPMA
jgi:hypothetical protein